MNGIMLSSVIDGISTLKDKSVKITILTQELSPSKAGEIFGLHGKYAIVYISEKDINQREIDQVDKLDPEFGGKTQSQRLRNVFFRMFEQDAEGYKDFNNYYHAKMEQLIEHYKSKLQPR